MIKCGYKKGEKNGKDKGYNELYRLKYKTNTQIEKNKK